MQAGRGSPAALCPAGHVAAFTAIHCLCSQVRPEFHPYETDGVSWDRDGLGHEERALGNVNPSAAEVWVSTSSLAELWESCSQLEHAENYLISK